MKWVCGLSLVFLSPFFSYAAEEVASSVRHWSVGAGTAGVFESSVSDEDYNYHSATILFAAYRWTEVEAMLETSFYETTDSVGNLSIQLDHKEVMPWLRYRFLTDRSWTPFVGASLGVIKEDVITQLATQTVESDGDIQWQAGVAVGVSADLWQKVRAEVDGKMLQPQGEPSLMWLFSARLGYLF